MPGQACVVDVANRPLAETCSKHVRMHWRRLRAFSLAHLVMEVGQVVGDGEGDVLRKAVTQQGLRARPPDVLAPLGQLLHARAQLTGRLAPAAQLLPGACARMHGSILACSYRMTGAWHSGSWLARHYSTIMHLPGVQQAPSPGLMTLSSAMYASLL